MSDVGMMLRDEITRLRAENERLREENENIKAANRYGKDWVDQASQDITRLRADLAAVTAERDRMREAVKESRQSWERIDKAHSFRVYESEMRLIKIFALEKENARLLDALKPFAVMMDAEHMLALVKARDSDLTRCIVKIGDLRRARAAIEGVTEPASPWRDIESAPKEQTILVYDKNISRKIVAAFLSENGCWFYAEEFEADPEGPIASHWMPLPEPPR